MSTSRVLGAVARLAASQHGVVTRNQAAEEGIHRNQIARMMRAGLLAEPTQGVLVSSTYPTSWQQGLVIAQLAQPLAVVSHVAGARLHAVEGFVSCERRSVTLPKGFRLRVPGLEVHEISRPFFADELINIDGLVCTGLARTLVDLAATEGGDALERALDDFERRGFSLDWLSWTAKRAHRPGQRGTNLIIAQVKARKSRGRVRGSWFQKLVKQCLESPLIPELEEEFEIIDRHGVFVARVDLAIPRLRFAIEAHSRRYHIGAAVEARDEERHHRVTEEGWQLEYVGYAATSSTPTQVRRRIERLVAQRARDLGITLFPGSTAPAHGKRARVR